MIRLLGVLVGSALAVAALVVFVGIPQFTTEANVAQKPVITLPIRPEAVPAEPPAQPVARADDRGDGDRAADTSDAEPAGEESVATASASPPGEPPQATRPDEASAAITQAAADPNVESPFAVHGPEPMHWYSFWSPFRSEIAAQGFVEQLQSVTGLDYRVVKVRTGTYEVAFAYGDDDEITANLSQISAATGLDLQGT